MHAAWPSRAWYHPSAQALHECGLVETSMKNPLGQTVQPVRSARATCVLLYGCASVGGSTPHAATVPVAVACCLAPVTIAARLSAHASASWRTVGTRSMAWRHSTLVMQLTQLWAASRLGTYTSSPLPAKSACSVLYEAVPAFGIRP